MTILEQVRSRLKEAMKNRNPEKDILRVYLAKLQQIEADEGAAKLTDDRCASVAKSIIKGNNDAIAITFKQVALQRIKLLPEGVGQVVQLPTGLASLDREGALQELAKDELTPLGKALVDAVIDTEPLPAGIADTEARLKAENTVLEFFLPSYLTPEQVTVALTEDAETLEKIKKANNDGAATGVAMKYLKGKDLKVDGNIVKEVAKIIWSDARTGGQ